MTDQTKPIRKGFLLYSDDEAGLEWIKQRYGIETDSQAIRLMIRIWREVIESGLLSDQTERIQSIIAHSHKSHSRHGRRGWREYQLPG